MKSDGGEKNVKVEERKQRTVTQESILKKINADDYQC